MITPPLHYKLNDRGEPEPVADVIEWAMWFETAKRTVARTEVGDLTVSTAFIGIELGFRESGPPLLWETMIFSSLSRDALDAGDDDPCSFLGEYQERYASLEDAKAGHDRAVARARTEVKASLL